MNLDKSELADAYVRGVQRNYPTLKMKDVYPIALLRACQHIIDYTNEFNEYKEQVIKDRQTLLLENLGLLLKDSPGENPLSSGETLSEAAGEAQDKGGTEASEDSVSPRPEGLGEPISDFPEPSSDIRCPNCETLTESTYNFLTDKYTCSSCGYQEKR